MTTPIQLVPPTVPWKSEANFQGPPADPTTATPLSAARFQDLENRINAALLALSARDGKFAPLGSVGGAVTLDAGGLLAATFTFVLTTDAVITVINAVAGSEVTVIPFQDSSPPHLIQHPDVVAWTSTGPPTLSNNAGAPDRFNYTVLAVDGSGTPTQIVGSLGFTSGAPPGPIGPPVVSLKRKE